MFNRLKNLGNKNTRPQRNSDENSVEQSGFICPICMKGLPSPELLQQHFDTDHSVADPPDNVAQQQKHSPVHHQQKQQPPHSLQQQQQFVQQQHLQQQHSQQQSLQQFNNTSNYGGAQDGKISNDHLTSNNHTEAPVQQIQETDGKTVEINGVQEPTKPNLINDVSLEEEVKDLKASLSEEKWYSAELKKELESLQEQNTKLSEEADVVKQQMKIASDTNEELAKQKQTLEQKALNMAQTIADVKASKDEINDLRISTLEKCNNQAIELEKAAEWVRDLESQLLQRPGADDVMVLKKELVSVQTLMDQLTLDMEKKSKEQEEKSEREKEEVEKERKRLHELLEEAKKKEKVVQEEFDAYKLENSRLKEQNKESELANDQSTIQHQLQQSQLLQQHDDQQNKIKEELCNVQESLSKEQDFSKSLQLEANKLEEEKVTLQDEIKKLTQSASELNENLSQEKNKIQQLENNATEYNLTIDNVKQSMVDLNKEMGNVSTNHKQELSDKEKEIENMKTQYEKLKLNNEENLDIIEQVNKKNNEISLKYEDLRKSNKDLDLESGTIRQQLEMEITQINIQIETLKSEKEKMEEEKCTMLKEWEVNRSKSEEQIALGKSTQLEQEREIMELKLKNTNYEENLKNETKKLEKIELEQKSNQNELRIMQEKFAEQSTEVALKSQELQTLKETVNVTSTKLEEEISRRELANDEAKKLREERITLMAKMEAGEGDEAAREQIQEENKELRMQKEELEDKFRSEMSTHEESNRLLTSQLNEFKTNLKTIQDKLELSEQSLEKHKELVNTEKEKFVQLEADLKLKGELLMTSQTAIMTQRSDMESHLNSVQKSLSEKIAEFEKLNKENVTNKSLLENMKAEMNTSKQDHVIELTKLKNNLENSQSIIKYSEEEAERWKKEYEEEKEKGERENGRKREELESLETKMKEKVSSMQLVITNLKDNLKVKGDEVTKVQDLHGKLTLDFKELNEKHGKLVENHQLLKSDIKLKEDKLSEMEVNVTQKEAELEKLSANQVKEMTSWKEKENVLKKEMEIERNDMSKKNNILTQEIKEIQNKLESENLSNLEAIEKLKLENNELLIQQTKLNELVLELNKSKTDSENELSRYSLESSQNVKMITELEEKLKFAKVDIKLKDNQINNQNEALDISKSDLKRVNSELTKITQLLNEKEQLFHKTSLELNDLKLKSEQLQTSDNDLREKLDLSLSNMSQKEKGFEIKILKNNEMISQLEENLKHKNIDCNELNEKLAEIKEKLNSSENESLKQKHDLEENMNSLNIQIKAANEEKSDFAEELSKKEIALTKLENLLKESKSELDSSQREMEEKNLSLKSIQEEINEKNNTIEIKNEELEIERQKTQEIVEEHERKWKEERKILLEQIESLESAQKLLISHKVELQSITDNLQENVEREKVETRKLEEKWKMDLQLKTDAISLIRKDLDERGRELERSEAERVVSESRLQLEISSLSENLNSVRSEWITTSQSLDKLKEENVDLNGQIVVLQAAQQSDADERRALLQRCLNSEQQIDQQISKIHELQKKLDNTQSAMHELGRENQALQVKHTTTISRQWADDKVANNCKACGRNFTLTVRRHHCRHCGEIYCSECSSRSAQVAASKNPVRVCEKCYDDLLVAS